MPKRSALKNVNCLIASLSPVMMKNCKTELEDAKNIEGLYRYVVELFEGISNNESNDFSGKFDFNVSLNPSNFCIYKKTAGEVANEKEYEDFMMALSIFQMVFIDENIYLSGCIQEKEIYLSKEGITWGVKCPVFNDIGIIVDDELSSRFEMKYVEKLDDKTILDFLSNVYKYHPFKDDKGNMQRHIINPIKDDIVNNKNLETLTRYVKQYIVKREFDITF